MKYFLIIVCFFIFASLGCSKKYRDVPVDAKLKSAFYFKVGTSWVYKDSISGFVDSFYVTESHDDFFSTTDGSNLSIENIAIRVIEVNIFPLPIISDTHTWIFNYVQNVISLQYAEPKIYSGTVDFTPFVNFPYKNPIEAVGLTSPYIVNCSLDNTYDTMVINGNPYYKVAKVHQFANILHNGYLTNTYKFDDVFWIAPNIGLVKIALNHSDVNYYRIWELIRCKIVI